MARHYLVKGETIVANIDMSEDQITSFNGNDLEFVSLLSEGHVPMLAERLNLTVDELLAALGLADERP
jgi:hypothetical protein